MPQPSEQEIEVFNLALDLPPGQRAAYLDRACAHDTTLRQRVEELLKASDESSACLDLRPSLSPAEKPGDRIGRYKLLEQIGEGGCGVVYMAEQEEPVRRRVALKVIKLGMDTKQVIARFEAERQALALMDCPNIAKVLDAGATDTGRPFFVMELVRGVKITDYCDQTNLNTVARLELFVQVCQAVQHAHQKGIIHRDIKPSNILVTVNDGVAVPKVIDFGIAKATQGRLTDHTLFTAFEQFLGTPAYMSPEQAVMTSLDIDTRSDVYSLGVLLYELLTSQTPFDAKKLLQAGLDEIRRTIREQEPARPSTRLSTMLGADLTLIAKHRQSEPPKLIHLLRGDLDWIVMKALEKDRGRRYETANGLAMDIERHLKDEPIVARPPSGAYRLQKLVRRHRLAFGAAALMAGVLLAAAGVSAWQAVRANRQARRAFQAEALAQQRLVESKTNEALATQRLADSEAIRKFLTEVFQSPDPARDGRTITVAETLGVAAKKLETDLATQPARRVSLQSALGATYYSLGLYPEAIVLQEKVRDYCSATLGLENTKTFAAMIDLANSYHAAGRLNEAIKLSEETLTLKRKMLGPEHPDTLVTMINVAAFYYAAGRLDEALKLQEQVLPRIRQALGPEHPNTLLAMNNLANSYDDVDRKDEALKLREEMLALSRKVLGPEHPGTLIAMSGLAHSYDDAGRKDEALKVREETLRLYQKVLGPEHPGTLIAMSGLAHSYDDAGRKDEALKVREETLRLYQKVLGPKHPDTIAAMINLAVSYDDAGRKDEAIKLMEETLPLTRKVLGPEHPNTLATMNNLASSYYQVGRFDEALELQERALPLMRKVLGPEHPHTLTAMNSLADSYDKAGRREDALKLREEMLALRPKASGATIAGTLNDMNSLADSYCSLGRSKDAITLMERACALDPKDRFESLRLAVYQAWFGQDTDYESSRRQLIQQAEGTDQAGTADKAAKAFCLRPSTNAVLLAKALNLARQAVELGKGDPSLPWYHLGLGLAEYRSGQYSSAEQALTIAEQTAGDMHDISGTARLFRAMSLLRQEKPEEARKVFSQAEPEMPPFPKDDHQPPTYDKPVNQDVLICWMVYKEAKALIYGPSAPIAVPSAPK